VEYVTRRNDNNQENTKEKREKENKNEWKHPGIETRGGVSSIAFRALASRGVSPWKGTPKRLRED
jgi:hypothetical protein